mgnify:CR=1 FL=1
MTDKDDLVKRLKLAAKGAEERGFGWSPELIREAADALEEARKDAIKFASDFADLAERATKNPDSKDAERYRWLRECDSVYPNPYDNVASDESIDAAIDAARREHGQG